GQARRIAVAAARSTACNCKRAGSNDTRGNNRGRNEPAPQPLEHSHLPLYRTQSANPISSSRVRTLFPTPRAVSRLSTRESCASAVLGLLWRALGDHLERRRAAAVPLCLGR